MIKKLHRIIAVAAVVLCINFVLPASGRLYIYDRWYFVDTLQCSKVGPGTKYTSVVFRAEDGVYTFRTFFLHIDVDNPQLKFVVEQGQDSLIGGEPVNSHAIRRTSPGKYYIAGANGDFYETSGHVGVPTSTCVQDGVIGVMRPGGDWMFGLNDGHQPWVSRLAEDMVMWVNGDIPVRIHRANVERRANQLTLFNSMNGKYTHTDARGAEIALKLVEGQKWQINSKMKFIVEGDVYKGGNMRIQPGQAVLSADGTAMPIVEGLKAGDVVEIKIEQVLTDEGSATPSITGLIGSSALLVRGGKAVQSTNMARHPRTMYGYSKDGKQIIICVLDGRSGISSGAIYNEQADIMVYAGAESAVNADGGGSSTLYIQNLGVMNRTSDGKPRAVSNGMYMVLEAPEDNVVASIEFKDWAMTFPKNGVYRPVIYGFNQYGMLIDTDVQGVTLSCDAALGHVENGNTFVGDGSGTHALIATYNGATATIPVTIKETDNIKIRLPEVVLDTYNDYAVEVLAEMNESFMPIASSSLSWSVDDNSVAEINGATGVVKGLKNGTATVTGTSGNFTGSINVVVEKPEKYVEAADRNMDITTWKVSSAGTKEMKAEAFENGMKLTYTGAGSRSPFIKLSKKLQLWSRPDSIRLRINPGDAEIKGIKISLATALGEVANVDLTTIPLTKNEMNIFALGTSEWCNANDFGSYPLTVNSITFNTTKIKSGQEYVIEIPGIEAIYKAVPEAGVESALSDKTSLLVTPNPVEAGEPVRMTLPLAEGAVVAVYNANGMQVYGAKTETRVITIPTDGMNAGVYLVHAEQRGVTETAKFIVK